jgi:cell wall-associated NlpC family hydrolase
VQQAYRAAGITIPRSTSEQISAGTAVADVNQIQPGDLLFIPGSNGTPQHPGHVGMAIGDGLLIQAPHTGDVVKITKVSQWADQISIIRRITT